LADKTYDEMVDNLQANQFDDLTAPLKQNIISFYTSADTIAFAEQDPKEWKQTYLALHNIKLATPVKTDSLKTAKRVYYKMQQ